MPTIPTTPEEIALKGAEIAAGQGLGIVLRSLSKDKKDINKSKTYNPEKPSKGETEGLTEDAKAEIGYLNNIKLELKKLNEQGTIQQKRLEHGFETLMIATIEEEESIKKVGEYVNNVNKNFEPLIKLNDKMVDYSDLMNNSMIELIRSSDESASYLKFIKDKLQTPQGNPFGANANMGMNPNSLNDILNKFAKMQRKHDESKFTKILTNVFRFTGLKFVYDKMKELMSGDSGDGLKKALKFMHDLKTSAYKKLLIGGGVGAFAAKTGTGLGGALLTAGVLTALLARSTPMGVVAAGIFKPKLLTGIGIASLIKFMYGDSLKKLKDKIMGDEHLGKAWAMFNDHIWIPTKEFFVKISKKIYEASPEWVQHILDVLGDSFKKVAGVTKKLIDNSIATITATIGIGSQFLEWGFGKENKQETFELKKDYEDFVKKHDAMTKLRFEYMEKLRQIQSDIDHSKLSRTREEIAALVGERDKVKAQIDETRIEEEKLEKEKIAARWAYEASSNKGVIKSGLIKMKKLAITIKDFFVWIAGLSWDKFLYNLDVQINNTFIAVQSIYDDFQNILLTIQTKIDWVLGQITGFSRRLSKMMGYLGFDTKEQTERLEFEANKAERISLIHKQVLELSKKRRELNWEEKDVTAIDEKLVQLQKTETEAKTETYEDMIAKEVKKEKEKKTSPTPGEEKPTISKTEEANKKLSELDPNAYDYESKKTILEIEKQNDDKYKKLEETRTPREIPATPPHILPKSFREATSIRTGKQQTETTTTPTTPLLNQSVETTTPTIIPKPQQPIILKTPEQMKDRKQTLAIAIEGMELALKSDKLQGTDRDNGKAYLNVLRAEMENLNKNLEELNKTPEQIDTHKNKTKELLEKNVQEAAPKIIPKPNKYDQERIDSLTKAKESTEYALSTGKLKGDDKTRAEERLKGLDAELSNVTKTDSNAQQTLTNTKQTKYDQERIDSLTKAKESTEYALSTGKLKGDDKTRAEERLKGLDAELSNVTKIQDNTVLKNQQSMNNTTENLYKKMSYLEENKNNNNQKVSNMIDNRRTSINNSQRTISLIPANIYPDHKEMRNGYV